MLGYHNSPYCSTDIWSPNPTRWGYNAIENRAFSPFCKHQQECEDIINMIKNGYTSFSLDDDFDKSDLEYINDELLKAGIVANLSLN